MKKITTVILLIALVFALTACDIVSGVETEKETPSQALINIMTAVKETNKEVLTNYDAIKLIGSADDRNVIRNKKIFEALEYNILSVEEIEESAKIKLEIKTKDLTTVPQDYANKSVALANENNNLGDNKLDDAAMKQKYNDLFVDIVDECEYTEFKEVVDVILTKEGSSWKINLDSKFQNAIYGNLVMAQTQILWSDINNQGINKSNDSEANIGNDITTKGIRIIQ
ncbi:hypothetical protein [Sedimentibacter sp.]|uniref:hypothetical protein n=1 Tax=Sedimentibacter sp. TaxID=1960295 RepID=UPI0028ADEB2D|nr:hypothetical protein [Sedimentibacter sp.]